MFGIRGLDAFGLFHASVGILALLLGAGVLSLEKGTRRHRRMGRAYAVAMLMLNATALAIYDLFGRFGPFHAAALISLATLGAGLCPVLLRRPRSNWMEWHATFMCWSYAGLVAAFVAEISVRLPGMRMGPATTIASVTTLTAGGFLIHAKLPRILARLASRRQARRVDAVG